jgi:hypothetical protein
MRIRRSLSFVALLSSAGVAAGCSSSTSSPAPDAGPAANPVKVTVSPADAKVLTCSKATFTAAVTGAMNPAVTWSVSPAAAGTVDASGGYTAPKSTPTPPNASVTATSVEDPSVSGSATLTLATAFPGAPVSVPGSNGVGLGMYQHAVSGRGSRAYSIWGVKSGVSVQLMLSRSNDGGATWQPATSALSATLTSDQSVIDCAAVAIDAGNPDVVYTEMRLSGANNLGAAAGATGETMVLGTSTDGGATSTARVMQVGGTAGGPHGGWDSVGICPDILSTAPNTIIVEAPGGYNGDGNPDIAIWADAAQGAGFGTGVVDNNNFLSNGYTDALNTLIDTTQSPSMRLGVAQNGGTDSAGGATESPRMFTDANGRLCLTYLGTVMSKTFTYVQCSSDAAKTFSPPLALDPLAGADEHSSPVGALGPDKAAAVVWTNGITLGKLLIATSTDAGATFGAPAAIPTYVLPNGTHAPARNPSVAYDANGVLWVSYRAYDGGTSERLIVDKSCDGGATWSGPVLVNGPEGSIANMYFPALFVTTGTAPHLLAAPMDRLVSFALE